MIRNFVYEDDFQRLHIDLARDNVCSRPLRQPLTEVLVNLQIIKSIQLIFYLNTNVMETNHIFVHCITRSFRKQNGVQGAGHPILVGDEGERGRWVSKQGEVE